MQSRWMRFGLAAAVGVALFIIRTWGISEHFLLLGEQVRDWRIALGPWRDLPWSGAPSSVGGRSLGPIYYWLLWAFRHTIGPFVSNLPHAGGIGQSLLQSIADAALLLALWRRFKSLPLALGVVLIVATNPTDMDITATIWNPAVAMAFVKLTIAIVIVAGPSIWWAVAATAAGVLAVQAHSSAAAVAIPVIAAFIAREVFARQWRRAIATTRAVVEVVVLLEIPYVADLLREPAQQIGGAGFAGYLGSSDVIGNWHEILWRLLSFAWPSTSPIATVLVAAALVWLTVRLLRERDFLAVAVTTAPVFLTLAAFTTWVAGFQSYRFMAVFPSLILTIALTASRLPRPAASFAVAAFFAASVLMVPFHIAARQTSMTTPVYGAMARGSLELRRRTAAVFQINYDFEVPYNGDRDFLYTAALGGRTVDTAPYVATIDRSGGVRFSPAPRP